MSEWFTPELWRAYNEAVVDMEPSERVVAHAWKESFHAAAVGIEQLREVWPARRSALAGHDQGHVASALVRFEEAYNELHDAADGVVSTAFSMQLSATPGLAGGRGADAESGSGEGGGAGG